MLHVQLMQTQENVFDQIKHNNLELFLLTDFFEKV